MQLCVVLVSGSIPFEFTFQVEINETVEQPRGGSKSLYYYKSLLLIEYMVVDLHVVAYLT